MAHESYNNEGELATTETQESAAREAIKDPFGDVDQAETQRNVDEHPELLASYINESE